MAEAKDNTRDTNGDDAVPTVAEMRELYEALSPDLQRHFRGLMAYSVGRTVEGEPSSERRSERRAKHPPHPFIHPRNETNDTALVIDALLAPVDDWLSRRCCGADDFDETVMHGHHWTVSAVRDLARYLAEAIEIERFRNRRHKSTLKSALDTFHRFEAEANSLSLDECRRELDKGQWRVSVPVDDDGDYAVSTESLSLDGLRYHVARDRFVNAVLETEGA